MDFQKNQNYQKASFFQKLERNSLFNDQLSFLKDQSFQQSFVQPDLQKEPSFSKDQLIIPIQIGSNFQLSNLLKPQELQQTANERQFSFNNEPSLRINNSVIQVPLNKKIHKDKSSIQILKYQDSSNSKSNKISQLKNISYLQQISQENKTDEPLQGQNLVRLLIKIFLNEKIQNVDGLISQQEYVLLKAILFRKFNLQLPEKMQNFSLIKDLQAFQTQGTIKPVRPEQNYKFVVKKVFKHIKQNFKNSTAPKIGQQGYDMRHSDFLQYYFQDIADSNNMPLAAFTPPTNSKCNTHFRSINRQYISFIELSQEFMQEFKKILHTTFMEDVKEEIKQKLKSLVAYWYSQLIQKQTSEEELKNYIMKNSWCKLPWTITEVNRAVAQSQNLFKTKL